MAITQERLKKLFSYDSATGVFKYASPRSRVRVGNVAGYDKGNGYRRIEVDGKAYQEHRLAWLYVYGEFPDGEVDHIDGNRANNAISNLRVVSHSKNCQNKIVARSDSSSGIIGVAKRGNKYIAEITANGIYKYLGRFATEVEAAAAYSSAKLELHGVFI